MKYCPLIPPFLYFAAPYKIVASTAHPYQHKPQVITLKYFYQIYNYFKLQLLTQHDKLSVVRLNLEHSLGLLCRFKCKFSAQLLSDQLS